MPFIGQLVHVSWSGEGIWIPLGEMDFGVDDENHTSHPAPGKIILYPGVISETEINSLRSRRFFFKNGTAGW